MIRKLLLITKKLIDTLLSESFNGDIHQQNVTVVGSNNIVFINGNTNSPNLMLPKNQNKVKRFPDQKQVDINNRCHLDQKNDI